MNFPEDIILTSRLNLLVVSFQNNYFKVENSIGNSNDQISKIVLEVLSSLHYIPVLSENRIGEKFIFSLIPLSTPDQFKKIEYKEVKLSPQELWSTVESTKTLAIEDRPDRVSSARVIQDLLGLTVCKITQLMVEFIVKCGPSGMALDLGCGTGVQSVPLIDKGWHVTAVDRYSEVFKEYIKYVNDRSKLTIVNKDVNEFDFPESKFDVVICINALNYFDNKKLQSLIEKIYKSLVPNGLFIGTIWFEEPGKPNFVTKRMSQMGAYMYRKDVAPALLVHSGFKIGQCEPLYEEKASELMSLQFVGKK